MSDWISREAAIGALEDRRNKYLEDGPNWLQIQMDILTIRALPAVQPDAAVLRERERCAKVASGVAWWEAGDTAAMIRKGESND